MANNQMVNFNTQDVANMYRRNQLAQALQERMNAPAPVHTFQGFQAPVSPLTGISKALDMYTAKKYDDQQEEKYQAEKAAAEQKVLDENSRLEQGRENFVSTFNQPTYSETPMPDARSSSESGIPLDQLRADVYTATPKTEQEKIAIALSNYGNPNPLIAKTAEGFANQANEDIKAKTAADLAASNREYTRAIQEQTRADMLSGREQAQSNADRTFGQSQSNADRTFGQKENEIEYKKEKYKPLTEYQGKSLSYGLRAMDANSNLERVGINYNQLSIDAAAKVEDIPGVGAAAYAALSPENKQVFQAQRNFINATLRQESGATINPPEFINARKQYFPQPGDDEGTLKQKSENRIRVISNFKLSAGPSVANQFDAPKPPITDTSPTEPMFASNGTSRITSTDGGKTWKEIK
jgi:hypothetical protein